jgi:hypothetical protein
MKYSEAKIRMSEIAPLINSEVKEKSTGLNHKIIDIVTIPDEVILPEAMNTGFLKGISRVKFSPNDEAEIIVILELAGVMIYLTADRFIERYDVDIK